MASGSSPTSHATSIDSLVLFAFSVAATLAWKGRFRSARAECPSDRFYLQLAHDYRRQLTPPQQSQFRVVAILLLANGETIFGTNDEPSPNISLAMCAERCALLRYRAQQCTSAVRTVYIVTDATVPVAPGTACREYMYGHTATCRETRIVLQSRDPQSDVVVQTLGELIPFPSLFVGMTPQEQLAWGEAHRLEAREQLRMLQVPGLTNDDIARLYLAALRATETNARESVHAIRYGAAAALQKSEGELELLQASQVQALEYSSTLDAMGQLASQIIERDNDAQQHGHRVRVLAVVQVDQFGIPHGVFAPARAFLVEHGFGDCRVILTSLEEGTALQVKAVPALDLAPLVPEFRSQDS